MGFINSYKRLEKLCNEIYGVNHGVSAYIDDMVRLKSASRYVFNWDKDLKQLKHYRWIRNKIVHELNCTEENMCKYGDAQWIDNFYDRIINQSDPIAMYYRKTTKPQPASKPKQTFQPSKSHHTPYVQQVSPKKKVKKSKRWIVFFMVAVLVGLLLVLKYFVN